MENKEIAFRHSRLSSPRSIRLLDLQPSAEFGSALEVKLFEARLDDVSPRRRRYEALSYVWGSPKGTRALTCDGALLLITPNCGSALRHLRAADEVRTLWVDAICIDQEDSRDGHAERSTQVPLMGEIYSRAEHTLCWLGVGTAFTADVMRHLEAIGGCPSQRGLKKLMHFEEQLYEKNILSRESSCLDHLFCDPWHSRVWTIQEVAFSADCRIVCGRSSMPWREYSAAAKFLIYDEFIETLDLQAARSLVSIDMRNVFRDYLLGLEEHADSSGDDGDGEMTAKAEDRQITFLTSCLTDVNQLRASLPEDKIYGLYSVYTSLGIPLPAADYSKPVARVYAGAAVAIISWSGSLRVLRDASSLQRDPTLPSWVPDWNDAQVRLFAPDGNATDGSQIGDVRPESLSPEAGRLRVRGNTVGEVATTVADGGLAMPFPTRSGSDGLSILRGGEYRVVDDVEFLRLLVAKIKFFRELLSVLHANPSLRHDGEEEEEEEEEEEDGATDTLYEILTLGQSSLDRSLFEDWVDILSYPEGGAHDQSLGRKLAEDWKAADGASSAESWTPELTYCATIAASLLSNSIRITTPTAGGTGPSSALALPLLPSQPEILDLMKGVSQNLADQSAVTVSLLDSGGDHRRRGLLSLGTTFQLAGAGDPVVLLEGADWPVVLRPRSSGDSSGREEWQFVGPAYVMGIMDGEAWTEANRQGNDLREFILS